jgi:glyoxylase-like metal-dependent hydrolase (beta-lactamase superfamily II)
MEAATERQEKQPAATEVTEVAPDVLRMQLPISLPGLGHVNCYALCDERGVAVVDPGLPGKASWNALVDRLGKAGYAPKDVHTVIVTHSHHDHFGGAGILRHEVGAEVLTHRAFRTWFDPDEGDDPGPDALDPTPDDADDAAPERDRRADGQSAGQDRSPWREMPWRDGRLRPPLKRRVAMRVARTVGRRWMRAPEPSRRVDDAEILTFAGREWVAVHTPGHTEDHLCLYSPADGIVLSGDHVLPTITPHISGMSAGHDPLREFFGSLDRVASLEGATLALPAHGHPFTDVAGRCEAIRVHHEERLQVLRDAARAVGEASVEELSKHLFKPRSWGPMAESETFAHLEHLRLTGEMVRRRVDDHLHFQLVDPDE